MSPIRQKGGKVVQAWAFAGDCDPALCVSNTFAMEWPPKSEMVREFQEIDRVAFFGVKDAKRKIKCGQDPLVRELKAVFKQSK